MTTPLVAEEVTKRYGNGTWALRELSLTISAGTITALVGPNGAGKSTLMKAWIGFERPTGGRVLVNGIDPWRRGGRRQAIPHTAYVPQEVALYRDLSVNQHLELVSTLRRELDAQKARHRLADLGIDSTVRAAELSGGQRAQLSLALALASGGQILILDEPLANLDPLARREFLQLVRSEVRSAGLTAVLSSHVITDVEEACDAIIVLAAGKRLLEGRVDAIVASHAVVDGGGDTGASHVGTFPGPAGRPLGLVHCGGGTPAGARQASLEEVVLGYLASTRREPTDNADRAPAW